MSRLTTKRVAAALVAVPALVLLLAATRTWLVGRASDPLLGGGELTAAGSQVAPGVAALAAVALVGLIATLTGGRPIRRAAAVVILLAAVGAAAVSIAALRDPQVALGRVAASGLGRTGIVSTSATITGWAWAALTCAAMLVLSCAVTLAAVGRWTGLPRRFQPPQSVAGQPDRGVRRSAWDEVSEGHEPTESARAEAEADADDGST